MDSAEFDGLLSVVSNCDFSRAATIESKVACATSRPTYCEVAFENLDDVIRVGAYAKIRTGGPTPDAIPPVEDVARFITTCALKRLPFKATAGLHHPIRSIQPLSYETGAPYALTHGFRQRAISIGLRRGAAKNRTLLRPSWRKKTQRRSVRRECALA